MARAVVIGGGPNGLIAATRLAKLGWRVVLVEATDVVGGVVGRGWLPHTAWMMSEVDGLAGLKRDHPIGLHGVREDGTLFGVGEDAGYRAWRASVDRFGGLASGILAEVAPRLRSDASPWPAAKAALGLRRTGADPMMELLRVAPLSAEDALAEHIADPTVRAVVAGMGLLGTWMGPLSPTGSAILQLGQHLEGREVEGGGPMLAAALEKAAEAAGVEIRLNTRATRISGGVVLAGGEEIEAQAVVAACDPRTALLQLVPPHEIPVRCEYQAQEHRVRGIVAVVRLDLSAPLEIGGKRVGLLHTATHPLQVERAFDAAKRRVLPEKAPVLLRMDHTGATAWVHGISQGHGSEAHDAVLQLVLGAMERIWPTIRDQVTGHQVRTPDDLERELGLAGGHLWAGELALDQLWSLRPGLDLSQVRTPIPGLYLASGGCHPCGGATGRPGWLAAEVIGRPGSSR